MREAAARLEHRRESGGDGSEKRRRIGVSILRQAEGILSTTSQLCGAPAPPQGGRSAGALITPKWRKSTVAVAKIGLPRFEGQGARRAEPPRRRILASKTAENATFSPF